jgi:CRP-like cAMP-binding protein
MSEKVNEESLSYLKETMDGYHKLSDETWAEFRKLCSVKNVKSGQSILSVGEIPTSFYFICKGIFRTYSLPDEEGAREVNKNFFDEGRFPGSISSLLEGSESEFALEALEDSTIIEIDHQGYRELLQRTPELMWYHITYLERHWVIEKEPEHMSLLSDDSLTRYQNFLDRYPKIAKRIPLHHIAARLGITPTQLSRIRKKLES